MVGCTYEMNRPVKKYPEVQSAKENLETKGVLVNELPIAQDLSRMVMEIVKDLAKSFEPSFTLSLIE